VHPYGLYLDGVRYSNSDTVLGVWIVNLGSGKRHVVAAIRKKIVCRCGCGGWCTWHDLLEWLRWSFEAMASATHPASRHDGRPWCAGDAATAAKAGDRLPMPACVLQLKGDWAELCERIGFFGPTSNLRGCICCTAPKDLFFELEGLTSSSYPEFWNPHTHLDWEEACGRCEQWVWLCADDHAVVVAVLFYDRRNDGNRGRRLATAIPHLGLRAGDRLEPSDTLADVGMFDDLLCPVRVLFWRTSMESMVRHRCPLMSPALGITIESTVCLDVLHTLHLGPIICLGVRGIWAVLWARAFGDYDASAPDQLQLAAMAFRQELHRWYRERHGLWPA